MSRRPRPRPELLISSVAALAPSLEDLSALLRRSLERGVRLRFPDEPGAVSDADAAALVRGVRLAADVQARLTAARLRDAVAVAQAPGRFPPGRPRSVDAERVVALRAAGMSAAAIARELGVARQSVYRKLREIQSPQTRRRRRPDPPGITASYVGGPGRED